MYIRRLPFIDWLSGNTIAESKQFFYADHVGVPRQYNTFPQKSMSFLKGEAFRRQLAVSFLKTLKLIAMRSLLIRWISTVFS